MNELQPTHLDLFSGIGGFALAAEWAGFRTIGFCEIEKYCQRVIAKNFGAVLEPAGSGAGNSTTNVRANCRRLKETPLGCGAIVSDASCEQAHEQLQRSEEPGEQSRGAVETGKETPRRENGESSHDHIARFCPIYPDIFKLDGRKYRGVTLITGGFPCQPFSVAGKRGGAGDDRALWPEMLRVIAQARPGWVLGENVPGIISMELDNVLSQLEGIGYATRAFVIPACAVDARHRRDRVWIIGRNMDDPEHDGLFTSQSRFGEKRTAERKEELQQFEGQSGVCDAAGAGLSDGASLQMGATGELQQELERPDYGDWCRWPTESHVGRVAHGVRNRVDRLKGLGNAIVPQVAYEILREIRKLI